MISPLAETRAVNLGEHLSLRVKAQTNTNTLSLRMSSSNPKLFVVYFFGHERNSPIEPLTTYSNVPVNGQRSFIFV